MNKLIVILCILICILGIVIYGYYEVNKEPGLSDIESTDFINAINVLESVTNTESKTLTPESDGYIHINAYEFHRLMNTVLRADNHLNISRNDFIEDYNGMKFAISGTLKYSNAHSALHFYVGDRSVEGGSHFDYFIVFRDLDILRDQSYDQKDVIIKGTLTKYDRGDGLDDVALTILN